MYRILTHLASDKASTTDEPRKKKEEHLHFTLKVEKLKQYD